VDAVENMEKARTIGVSAFAIFFIAVAPQKAHWYNMMTPSTSDTNKEMSLGKNLLKSA
jgi:hypothetical protein